MMKKRDLRIVSYMRKNSRETLTKMSRQLNIPVSTIYDKLKNHYGNFIRKHTTLLNFSMLGYDTRANIMIRVNRTKRAEIEEFLSKHFNVNSLYKINNGYDFLIETIFKNIKQMEDFIEYLEQKFKINKKEVHFVVEDIERESFLSDPDKVDLVMNDGKNSLHIRY